MVQEASPTWKSLAKKIDYLKPEEFERVKAAYKFARKMHGDQRRKSGELFFTHPLTVATYLADYKLDADALIAALLHDVAEDTVVSVLKIESMFGADVARIVDGVTKFKQTTDSANAQGPYSKEQLRNATLLKLFEFMAQDVRVVIIKLFDRLHNMRTMDSMPQEKRLLKANETLYVYAPLANRLGMWELKNALQSLALYIVDEAAFYSIQKQLDELYFNQEFKLKAIRRQIKTKLDAERIPYIDVIPSPRNVYTVYEKARQNGASSGLDIIPRLVVVVPHKYDCYTALGAIHEMWGPVNSSFDDYIARPRENLYRALHTTVIHKTRRGHKGQRIKLRFRTEAMNIASGIGVLARWAYGGHSLWSPEMAAVTDQVSNLLESIDQDIKTDQDEFIDPTNDVRGVVEDILQADIVAFTPNAEAKSLPEGATPIDFAYTVHSDIGNSCRAARVNGELVPLNHVLQDGDLVEILTFTHPQPQRIWLDENLGFVKTTRARQQVRRHFRKLDGARAIRQGRELLRGELNRVGQPDYSHDTVAKWMGYSEARYLYYALGRAEILVTSVAIKVLTDRWNEGPMRHIGRIVDSAEGEGFIINNAGDRTLRLCQSCNARPGDAITGFIRKDGGITIHQAGCHTLPPDPYSFRTVRLSWGEEEHQVRLVEIDIQVYDRPHLLYEISDVLQLENINIASISTKHDENGFHVHVGLEVLTPAHLIRILHRIQALVNVRLACVRSEAPPSANTTASSFYQPE
jgi:GTP pyrophosphokinase